MKWNSRRVSAWAYAAPADLRKGFDGLSALVLNELRRDPLSGDLYLFGAAIESGQKICIGMVPVYASTRSVSREREVRVSVVGGRWRAGTVDDERAKSVFGRKSVRWKNIVVSARDDAVFSCHRIEVMI